MRVLSPNAIVLKALACTCPDYRIVLGSWKIDDPLLDTLSQLDRGEVYVNGAHNRWNDDYRTMYDYMVAEGDVVGIDRVSEGDRWNPVINVANWGHISEIDYFIRKWISLIGVAVSILWLWTLRKGSE
ncbi:MAG: hypothetical protein R2811_00350 [Flavobacteriales bacterium]